MHVYVEDMFACFGFSPDIDKVHSLHMLRDGLRRKQCLYCVFFTKGKNPNMLNPFLSLKNSEGKCI